MKKKIVMVLCVLFCCLLLVGCEKETMLRVAHISDNTAAKSANHSIKVVLEDDERVKEKFVDLQIKSGKPGQKLLIGEDRHDKTNVVLEKADFWYNLTYLLDKANGIDVKVEYSPYKEYGDKVFNFNVPNDVKLTFRVVAGNTKKDQESGDEILVLSEDISDEVIINAKKST